jgi:hypothetical protein
MHPYGLKYGAHVCEGKLCCGGPDDKLRIKRRERQKSKEEIKDEEDDTCDLYGLGPDDEPSGFGASGPDQ